jgi:hypothetical protein
LSLLVHGNDHERAELGRDLSPGERLAVALEALERVAAFEREHGLEVARVMVPPHNVCPEAMMEALLSAGFEALCYRDLEGERPTATRGWHPADFESRVGLPVVQRVLFGAPVEELVLRAFLGQPLVLAGHHVDFKDGLEPLALAAQRVNDVGNVQWLRMDAILRSNFATRRSRTTLHVRPWSRVLHVDAREADGLVIDGFALPPPDRERVIVERPSGGAAVAAGAVGELIGVPREQLVLRLAHDAVRPPVVRPRRRAWPFLRRRLSETRDRLLPVLPS